MSNPPIEPIEPHVYEDQDEAGQALQQAAREVFKILEARGVVASTLIAAALCHHPEGDGNGRAVVLNIQFTGRPEGIRDLLTNAADAFGHYAESWAAAQANTDQFPIVYPDSVGGH
jgi:hypothetical protein